MWAGLCCWVMPFSQGVNRQWTNCCWPRAYHYFSCMRALGFHGMRSLLEWMPWGSSRSAADGCQTLEWGGGRGDWRACCQQGALLEVLRAGKDRCVGSQNASSIDLLREDPCNRIHCSLHWPQPIVTNLRCWAISLQPNLLFYCWLQWGSKWCTFSQVFLKSTPSKCEEL